MGEEPEARRRPKTVNRHPERPADGVTAEDEGIERVVSVDPRCNRDQTHPAGSRANRARTDQNRDRLTDTRLRT